jgi:manganese/iron transport system ATP-binding protein
LTTFADGAEQPVGGRGENPQRPPAADDHTRPALLLERATVTFGHEVVLDGVTGALAPGGSLALVGPNGAGKTTLIKAVLGLVPLAGGRIEVLGGSPARARRRVAYIPQAETLDPAFPITVEQVVLMGRFPHIGWIRRPGAADRHAARSALEQVRLTQRAGDRFGVLSGGQRQRVLLARAIAQEADLLLLDEPFNGVDAHTTEVLLGVLARMRSAGAAVVLSTHDLAVAHLACGDACLLNRRQIAFGPIREALTRDLLRQCYGSGAVVLAEGSMILATG